MAKNIAIDREKRLIDEPHKGHNRADITLAARNAVINMIELLQERGWSKEQAYVLCSGAVDLKVSNVVDVPNAVVSAVLPEGTFQGQRAVTSSASCC